MNNFVKFLLDYYLYILGVLGVLIITIIGYLADNNQKRKKKEKEALNSANVSNTENAFQENGLLKNDFSNSDVQLAQNTTLEQPVQNVNLDKQSVDVPDVSYNSNSEVALSAQKPQIAPRDVQIPVGNVNQFGDVQTNVTPLAQPAMQQMPYQQPVVQPSVQPMPYQQSVAQPSVQPMPYQQPVVNTASPIMNGVQAPRPVNAVPLTVPYQQYGQMPVQNPINSQPVIQPQMQPVNASVSTIVTQTPVGGMSFVTGDNSSDDEWKL